MGSFEGQVKKLKAVEWLLQNDVVVRAAAMGMSESATSAIMFAAEYGDSIREKVHRVADRMTVTDRERREGYPLPVDDDERRERMRTIESMRKFKA